MLNAWYRAFRPALRFVDPETAHRLAVATLSRMPLALLRPDEDDSILATRVWHLDLPNPLGLAAGFDKNAEAPDALLGLGFGHVEIGTATPLPQAGNPRPRVFRLAEDRAVVNRYGFNSRGLEAVRANLAGRRRPAGLVGANVGRNKETADETVDFAAGIEALAPLADYLVINVSSPNTPGLRELQARAAIERLIRACQAARARAAVAGRPTPPLLVKLAPDLDDAGLADAAEAALATGLDGLVMGNTTLSRPAGLRGAGCRETGGLSGRPLRALATERLGRLFRLTEGRLPLVGLGGVESGADAYARIRAGASLVQLYTALVYEGPGLAARVKRELAALLRRDGFASVAEAVGADRR